MDENLAKLRRLFEQDQAMKAAATQTFDMSLGREPRGDVPYDPELFELSTRLVPRVDGYGAAAPDGGQKMFVVTQEGRDRQNAAIVKTADGVPPVPVTEDDPDVSGPGVEDAGVDDVVKGGRPAGYDERAPRLSGADRRGAWGYADQLHVWCAARLELP